MRVAKKSEKINQNLSNVEDAVISELHRGIAVVNDPKYGTYLSFKTKKVGENVYSYLKGRNIEQRKQWEDSFTSFVSIRKVSEILKNENWSMYGDDPMASMINEKGYFMYDGQLYRDVQLGKELYKIEDGKEILIEKSGDPTSVNQYKTTACNNRSHDTSRSDIPCTTYVQDQRDIKGYIKYANPVFSSPYVKVRTELTTAICGSYNWVSTQCENIGTEYSYNIYAGGQNWSGTQQQHIAYNSTYAETQICSGSGLCIGYVICNS